MTAVNRPMTSGSMAPGTSDNATSIPGAWKARPQAARKSTEVFLRHAAPEGPSIPLPMGAGPLANNPWAVGCDKDMCRSAQGAEPTMVVRKQCSGDTLTVLSLDARLSERTTTKFQPASLDPTDSDTLRYWKRTR